LSASVQRSASNTSLRYVIGTKCVVDVDNLTNRWIIFRCVEGESVFSQLCCLIFLFGLISEDNVVSCRQYVMTEKLVLYKM